jgi:toxin ParE1/3/4
MSSRKLPVILTDEARDDFESIALYGLLTWGEKHAESYHAQIADVLDNLATFPRMGRLNEDLASEIRSIGVGHHRILYRVEEHAVHVLRILHERMDATQYIDL